MDPSPGDSIGLNLADQTNMFGNSAAVAALGGRPPSAEISQGMSVMGASSSSGLMTTLGNNNIGAHSVGQQRGLKRPSSDCFDDSHNRASSSTYTSHQSLDNRVVSSNIPYSNSQQQSQSGASTQDLANNSHNLPRKKSPPANGKKTKGRVKLKMEYIDNKLRRYTTFSKRKTGIMKKAYELSTLTGTQVMLLVASETGHVYTFATRKLQPMITSEAGKQLIQTCLNSPDPPGIGGGGDQRMSATGFEETELSYNIADEDSKEIRSPSSSLNDSEESSDEEGISNDNNNRKMENNMEIDLTNSKNTERDKVLTKQEITPQTNLLIKREKLMNLTGNSFLQTPHDLSNVPQKVLLQLIESGHLEVHTEEDGSGHQYVAIPLTSADVKTESQNPHMMTNQAASHKNVKIQQQLPAKFIIKEEK